MTGIPSAMVDKVAEAIWKGGGNQAPLWEMPGPGQAIMRERAKAAIKTVRALDAQGIETAKPPRREPGLARKGESPVGLPMRPAGGTA